MGWRILHHAGLAFCCWPPLSSKVRPHKPTALPTQMMNFAIAAFTVAASSVAAQSLPPPSRTVYKCEDGKKVNYSDSPCLGAKKVDVEPTRGLNKSSGREQVGQDVRREKNNELMAEALRPILNETPDQRAMRHKRFKLEPSAKTECAQLDVQIPLLEAREPSATSGNAATIERVLLASRTRFQTLRC